MTASAASAPPAAALRTAVPDPPARVDRATAGLVAVVLAPLVTLAVRLLTAFGGAYHASSDNALNELRIRDLGHHLVLLGPYSRTGWSHPGPTFSYVAWLPYRVFGSTSTALLVAALLINGAAMAGMVLLARRRGGIELALTVALGLAVLVLTFPSTFLSDPWNPYVTVMPFGAFVLAVWVTTAGDGWALPLAGAVGTYCVQTHIGYALPVVTLVAVAAFRLWRLRPSGTPYRGRPFLIAVGVLALLWLPALVEQLTQSPGNLRQILYYFLDPSEAAQGLDHAVRVVAAQFSWHADWFRGLQPVNPFSSEPAAILHRPVPVLLVPFAVAVGAAWRGRRRDLTRLGAVLALAVLVAVAALAQILGSMFEYRLRWLWVLGMLCAAYAVAVGLRVLRDHAARVARVLRALVLAGVLVLAIAGTARGTDGRPPFERKNAAVAGISRQVHHHLPAGTGPILLQSTGFGASETIKGLALYLERHGVRVSLPKSYDHRLAFGAHRVDDGGRVRGVLVVAEGSDIAAVARRPGARQIATNGRLGPEERARLTRRLDRLRRHPGSDILEEGRLLRALRGTSVFLVPANRANRTA